MNIQVKLYDGDGSIWNNYVTKNSCSSNYHLYGWRNVIEKSFGHKSYYLIATKINSEICGILPLVFMKSAIFGKFLISLPFFNYGGVLYDNEEAASLLLKESSRILEEVDGDYVELRQFDLSFSELETKSHKVSMILELANDEGTAWNRLDTKVRNQVRKAEKSGLTVVIGRTELLNGFYEVFSRNMRDLGTPVYSKDFFRNILEAFPATTCIISVKLKENTVASGIMTWFRDTLEIPWASSICDYREICPNNLLYWEAIKYSIKNGFSKFDFGRSTRGDGSFRFKKQWGCKQIQLYWRYLLKFGEKMPEININNPKYAFAIRVWQMLPLKVTNIIGPWIVKKIP